MRVQRRASAALCPRSLKPLFFLLTAVRHLGVANVPEKGVFAGGSIMAGRTHMSSSAQEVARALYSLSPGDIEALQAGLAEQQHAGDQTTRPPPTPPNLPHPHSTGRPLIGTPRQ
jgi:hypothetical protein